MSRYDDRICGKCKWHVHEDIDDGWVCVNDRSEYCTDWTEYADSCNEFEERSKRMKEIIVKLTSDHIKVKGAEYVRDFVRCQDCKYWVYNFNGCSRNPCTDEIRKGGGLA